MIHPDGFRYAPEPVSGLDLALWTPPKGFGERGTIRTFSAGSRRRLRRLLLEHTVPGTDVYNMTLTLPDNVTPDEWHRIRKRYFAKLRRAGIVVVWRVELQKRKVPHLHLVLWVPKSMPRQQRILLLDRGWFLNAPAEMQTSPGFWKRGHDMQGPFDSGQSGGRWFEYLAAHTGKAKKEQLGWLGRQWGVVNAELMQHTPSVVVTISREGEKALKRILQRWHLVRQKHRREWRRSKGRPSARRCRKPFFFEGKGFERFMPSGLVSRILSHLRPGEGPPSLPLGSGPVPA